MRTQRTLTISMSCLIVVGFSFSAREPRGAANVNAYPYGTTTCRQGVDGPGLRLFLRQDRRCEGNVSYPYLEMEVREQPISNHESIGIGTDNQAFRCLSPKESCQPAQSGTVVFDHFEDTSGKGIQTDGYYELKFSTGKTESGLFKVDCIAPCG